MSANGDIQDKAVLETEPPSVDAPSANESAHHNLIRLPDSAESSVTTDPEGSEDGKIDNRQPALHRLLLRMSELEPPIGKEDLDSELSKALSEDKSQLSLHGADGKTALHVATKHGLVDAAEWLIDAGADISLTDNDGRQSLHTACLEGHTKVAELLLKKGASAAATDNVGYQPLHMACFLGHSELARLLLRNGADIEARQHTDHAATPLYEAAWNGHVDVVDLLLKAGANTKSLTGTNWSSLHAASWNGHAEVVSLLIAKDKSNMDAVEQNNNWTALNAAVYGGHANVVSILLEHGSTLATRDNDGWSPLLTAANKHPDLIEMLLQSGRPSEELQLEAHSNRSKSTPLLATSLEGFVGGVRRLIDAGADLSAQDIDGDTALHRASGVRDDEWGFDDLTDEDRHNSKFIDLPADRHGAVVQLLLNAGAANLSARNKDGRTALYLAFKGYGDKPPNETVMRILLKWSELEKADFGVDDVWKEAVEWAAGNSKTHDIAQLLFEKKLKASQPPAPINRNAIGWAAHERNTNVLALLVSTSPQTGDISNALKSALKSLVPQSTEKLPDEPEGAQFFKVLWLLISACARDSEIENDIRNALNSVQKLNSQTQGPVPIGTNKGQASYGAQQEPKTKSNQSTYLQTIEDILREPPYPLMHHHKQQYRLPLPKAEAKDLLERFEVPIVQFYKSEIESGTIRRYRQLKEVIYDKGPQEIMTTAVKELANITGGDSLFPGHSIGLETKPAFTWIHLPSTNINWMNVSI
ncbi:unnamed protein product [Clonostachys byssicola]|uniref:Ankyrin repeat protein n=1 Tax=Clonostachys byssicola TaxID=160290 RepID=A0A9N9XZS6_9HYPO|nr:unnamed protein product [Clonostachys byssicola]